MSLVIHNAYRFPIEDTRRVNDVIQENVKELTAKIVNDIAPALVRHIENRDELLWLSLCRKWTYPSMPKKMPMRRLKLRKGDADYFARAYLYEYDKWASAYVHEHRLFDTDFNWSFTWDAAHTYLVLYAPGNSLVEGMITGLDDVLESFSYDGRVMETTHPKYRANTVKKIWERVIGDESMSDVGANARLSDFEKQKAYGLIWSPNVTSR